MPLLSLNKVDINLSANLCGAVKTLAITRPRVQHLENKSQFCKSLFLHSGAHQIERLEFETNAYADRKSNHAYK